jgi:hypothetical protein
MPIGESRRSNLTNWHLPDLQLSPVQLQSLTRVRRPESSSGYSPLDATWPQKVWTSCSPMLSGIIVFQGPGSDVGNE